MEKEQEKAAPAKSKVKAVDYKALDSEKLEKYLKRACKSDDADLMREILDALKCGPGSEITHSKTPMEYALEADAVKTFSMLAKWKAKSVDYYPHLKTRLWGGQNPVHHCAFMPGDYGFGGHGAPKCLAFVLSVDPLAFSTADEEGRTALDWASMNPKGNTFAPLFKAAKLALATESLTRKKFDALMEKAAFFAVGGGTDPETCMAVLKKIDGAGMDWKSLRSKHGQSLLGVCVRNCASERGHQASMQKMALMLMEAGASMHDPYVEEPNKYDKGAVASVPVSCLDFACSIEGMGWLKMPKIFSKMMESMDDASFVKKVGAVIEDWGPAVIDKFASSGEGPIAQTMSRYRSLVEAREIASVTGGPTKLTRNSPPL